MAWPRSILTDSGGYQVFSLAPRRKMSEEGVEFQSHVDGSKKKLTPEITTQFQMDIGADILMCLDDCPPYPSLQSDAAESMERTLRWAARCKATYEERLKMNPQADLQSWLFGITQGASFPELRKESAERTAKINFPGYAIGGLGVGEPKDLMWKLLEASISGLPDDRPHYMMGIGQPEDMWEGIERGVDMFDCVLPTRNGRNGQAFTSRGRLNVPNSVFRHDFRPLDEDCGCEVCKKYHRAYLCHLFRAGELLGPRLVTLHNLSFMISLLSLIRESIVHGQFQNAKRKFFERYELQERVLI
jgi:queuine tRNA-ribosyltransferase